MKKIVTGLLFVCLLVGCAATGGTSSGISSVPTSHRASSASSAASIVSNKTSSAASSTRSLPSEVSFAVSIDFTGLSGNEYYLACLEAGKYDAFDIRIGDPIGNAENEFGKGEPYYYGLGADCYYFENANVTVAYVEDYMSYRNKILFIDIIGVEGEVTVFGLTTGKSTPEDVQVIFGENHNIEHHSYGSSCYNEDVYDEGEDYETFGYCSDNGKHYIRFFFEKGSLNYISLGTTFAGIKY
ncbi:MAG TPA: hypothetical protein PK629_09430 [Oscillospiraceae bacterium]|nr:hypothetical protein [Oscillospiraceae bacterium]HPF54967.1 hypothetical protein [Clostridiales bacterium]HPK34380.1 hypothetical protein [Oscillospiraceae bacterium]HPR75826.1 hypothetical protein [Oscillospiraceae bacterium]